VRSLPAKAWQQLISILIFLGVPAAVGAGWQRYLTAHPAYAVALGIGWLVASGVTLAVRRALGAPVGKRLDQAGNVADQAFGWWLSGYGRRYLQWVLDSRRYVNIQDLATGGDHTPELDDVYVDVALVQRAPHEVSGNPLSGIKQDMEGRHQLDEFLNRRERVVLAVLGPPGSGKSTLLAHAARRNARGGRVPILLALRGHAGLIVSSPAPSLPSVIRSAVSGMPGGVPDGWWERQLRRGRCLVLLDGLDEVTVDPDRRAVTRWVQDQIDAYPGNHFVITSRPYGYKGLVIPQADVLAIRPLTAEQVATFLNRWYLAAARHRTGARSTGELRATRILAEEESGRLLSLLRAHPALDDLTVNPLLLTMIAIAHQYKGALPGSRADLYGEICHVMLSRRIQAKELPELMPWASKRRILADLATQMMLRKVSWLSATDVLAIISPPLNRLAQPVPGDKFIADITRNGLLVEPVPGRYAFTHLTFQEYLAAVAAQTNSELAKALCGTVDDPWWRETTLLYAATTNASPVVRACLDKGTISALDLAFDCAETSNDIDPDLRLRLDVVYQQAFKPGATPEHRKLIAGVLATRLSRQTLTVGQTRICNRSVPSDLYWLFLRDTSTPQPDSRCEPDPDRPVTGVWGNEALTFVAWLNSITVDSLAGGFRLPHPEELTDEIVAVFLAEPSSSALTGFWTRRQGNDGPVEFRSDLGQGRPHLVKGSAIMRAAESDARERGILFQTILASSFQRILGLIDHLEEASRTGLGDSALAGSIRTGANDGRNMAGDIAADLSSALSLDRGRTLSSALDHANALFLPRTGKLSPDRARDLARDLASVLDLDADFPTHLNHDASMQFATNYHLPLTWIADGPLGSAVKGIKAKGATAETVCRAFAAELTSAAAVTDATMLLARLDDNSDLVRLLREKTSPRDVEIPRNGKRWFLPLAGKYEMMLTGHEPISGHDAAGMRVIALALAAETGSDKDLQSTYQSLAATVTLIQQRQAGSAPVGEAIVLAIA
jgi:hypothetical protein